MTWQPIETAPKVADLFILAADADSVWLAYWDERADSWFNRDDYLFGPCSPTHWMPLPEPPRE